MKDLFGSEVIPKEKKKTGYRDAEDDKSCGTCANCTPYDMDGIKHYRCRIARPPVSVSPKKTCGKWRTW